MSQHLINMCSEALAIVIGTGQVTLTYRNGRAETISYRNWGADAPKLVEGAFVESVMTHNPIVAIA